jgi:hypothetical protein
MQEYLRGLLNDVAGKPDMKELIDRVERRVKASGVSLSTEEILEALDEVRR